MKVYDPGTLPKEIWSEFPQDAHRQAQTSSVAVSGTGACIFNEFPDHVMISRFIGSGTVSVLAMKPYVRSGKPIYFLGHTPNVIEWGKTYFEEVGTLFRYKGGKHGKYNRESRSRSVYSGIE